MAHFQRGSGSPVSWSGRRKPSEARMAKRRVSPSAAVATMATASVPRHDTGDPELRYWVESGVPVDGGSAAIRVLASEATMYGRLYSGM